MSYDDVNFYTDRLKSVEGKVLEAACGSGRVLLPLLQAGIEIEGMDQSGFMLDACRKKCAEQGLNPNLTEADMVLFDLNRKYEAVIIPAGSIQLIETRDDLIRALKCFHEHLTDNGTLWVDTFLPTDLDTEIRGNPRVGERPE